MLVAGVGAFLIVAILCMTVYWGAAFALTDDDGEIARSEMSCHMVSLDGRWDPVRYLVCIEQPTILGGRYGNCNS